MCYAILRLSEVKVKTGHSRSTIYKRVTAGLFTKPVKIGERSSGWPDYEVDAINATLIAGKSDDDIRALVVKLEEARKKADKQPSLKGAL